MSIQVGQIDDSHQTGIESTPLRPKTLQGYIRNLYQPWSRPLDQGGSIRVSDLLDLETSMHTVGIRTRLYWCKLLGAGSMYRRQPSGRNPLAGG